MRLVLDSQQRISSAPPIPGYGVYERARESYRIRPCRCSR